MEVSPAKSLILSATIHGGSYFFIQPVYHISGVPINLSILRKNPINLFIFQILFLHIGSCFFFVLFPTFPRKAAGS